MPAQPTEWTVEMVRALPDDGNRYEVIDGELFVTPAPSVVHQRAVLELALIIAPYARTYRIGEALIAPADVIVYGPRKLVQPDVFVVPLVNGAPMKAWTDVGRLLLTVEVLSPSTVHTDRGRKRILYQEKGVPEYWIVDTDARVIERRHPNDLAVELLTASIEWSPDPEVPALVIDLPGYFDRVHGIAQHALRAAAWTTGVSKWTGTFTLWSTTGHVAFFVERQGDKVKLLGGNQVNGTRVSESLFAASTVLGYRWPTTINHYLLARTGVVA